MVDGTKLVASEKQNSVKNSKKRRLFIIIGSLLVIILALGGWLLFKPTPVTSPFDAKTLASLNFPAYYPTYLPPGYKIDNKSVNEPRGGVVVFNLIGPKNQKIYISQESRLSTFNYGGYYKNFKDLKETVILAGTIAVGRINNGQTEIGSLVNDKTWIIVNTNSTVPFDELTHILKNLAVAH